jgi:hypothetical protein
MAVGVRQRHGRGCLGEKARCSCPWEAFVYSKRDKKKIRKTFPRQAEAQRWREDAKSAVRKNAMRAPTPTTAHEAADAWLDGARNGVIRNRAGIPTSRQRSALMTRCCGYGCCPRSGRGAYRRSRGRICRILWMA